MDSIALTIGDQIHKSFYKRYHGTIAGKNVTAHIIWDGSNLNGTYYYDERGIPISLLGMTYSSAQQTFRFLETEFEITQEWIVGFYGDSLIGKWRKDGGKTFDIRLVESTDIDLVFWSQKDSMSAREGQSDLQAMIEAQFLVPEKSRASFETALVHMLTSFWLDKDLLRRINTLDQFWDTNCDTFFKYYENVLSDLSDTERTDPSLSYFQSYYTEPYYDRDSILVIGIHYGDYAGGAHPNGGSFFLNYDFKRQQELTLSEIMTVDTAQLVQLLEREARKKFEIPDDRPLRDHLNVDEMFVSDKFFITHTGITFNYWPYQIAAYIYGPSEFFVPYNEIRSLLKPAFMKRMGI